MRSYIEHICRQLDNASYAVNSLLLGSWSNYNKEEFLHIIYAHL